MAVNNRIESYNFITNSITSDSNGLFEAYSENDVIGRLNGIQVFNNNFTANGSFQLFLSGNNELLWRKNGIAGESGTFYPREYVTNNVNDQISGTAVATTQALIVGKLRLVGSGLGDSKSGIGISIYYD
ncbi:MAG: hypothetical protein IIA87_03665 [Nanoarchaeota archaeon]|nr:hypothetical protein [Nanoarchaeota archaeon]